MPCLGAAGRGYDLRSPLGVTPAALAALALPEPQTDPQGLFQHFCTSRKQQRTEEVHRVVTPTGAVGMAFSGCACGISR